MHTEQKLSIEEWLENTYTAKTKGPTITPGLVMPEKSLPSLEPQPDMDKELWRGEIEDSIRDLEERVWKSGLQQDTVQEKITSLEERLSMRDFIQQHTGLKERLAVHERLLENANQQINTQQELIKHLFEAQTMTSQQVALITQKLSQPKQFVQQPQKEEPEGQHSNLGGVNKSTDASDYVLVSEDEAITS
jgi:chromosome segregation ATPase